MMTTTEYTNAYRTPSDRIRAALLTARLAARNRTCAQEQYRQALITAHQCGATYAELAAVLHCTRQAVRQYLTTNH